MSRENDSPPSGPGGRGDAAYPPGTPPYAGPDTPTAGPPAPAPGTGAGRDGDAGVPATETTLTTRIRINIPGSRPIPPVVVRQPLEDGAEDPDGAGAAPAPAPPPGPPGAAAAAAHGRGGDAKPTTSDWFAPRKAPKDPTPAQGSPEAAPTGPPPAGPPPMTPPAGPTGTADGSGMQFPAFPPRSGEPAGPTDTPPVGVPQAHPAPTDTGSMDVPVSESGHGFAGDDPANALPVRPSSAGGPPRGGAGGPGGGPSGPGGVPSGPTSGPATGGMPLKPAPPAAGRTLRGTAAPPATGGMGDTAVGGIPAVPPGPDPTPAHGVPQTGPGEGPGHTPAHGVPQAGPGQGPGHTPAHGIPHGGPRAPGPEGAHYPQEAAHAPGFTPPGQPAQPGPAAAPPPGPAPGGASPPVPPPAPAARSRSGSAPGRARGDRKKLAVMAGAGVFGVLCIAYGAGLVLNNDDVPKGTTVLGVDIGGSSRDQAVAKLDAALQERTKAPLVLRVGDAEQKLTPESAGLGIDTAESVRSAMGSDYNPVSVIGSLFGGSREVDPAMVDDEDKLRAQLQEIADETGGGKDGMIRFEEGEAVPVPGEPHEAVDVDKSMNVVQEAFDQRAAGGANKPVTLPVSQQQPAVSQAEFDSAMNGFAETAMSGYVAVQAGDRYIEFSPERSISQFLTMQATPDGNLAPKVDLAELEALYGSTFDGLLVERGDGSKTEITPQDVASALMGPLRETDPAKRVGVIDVA